MKTGKSKKLLFESLESKRLLAADGAELIRDSFEVRQNADEMTLDVLANDQFDDDYAGGKLITSARLGSQGGKVEVAADGKTLLYSPPAGVAGSETFSYSVDRDFQAIVSIEITAPLRDDHYEFVPDRESYELDVLANDPFWESYAGPRQISLVSASSNGATVEIADDRNLLRYARQEHRYGNDTLTYIVDGKYPATVQIGISDPLKSDRFQLVQFDAAQSFNVVRDDPFWSGYQGNRKITHILDIPEGATAEISEGAQSIVFSPNDIRSGVHRLRYVVDSTFETTVSFHVERPVADDHVSVDANSQSFEFELLENDFYRELGNYRITHDVVDRITDVSQTDQGGVVVVTSDGQGVLYTPPKDYVGDDSFVYTADGKHEARVNITVRDPEADNGQRNDHYALIQGTVDNRLTVLQNDFFGDGYAGARIITSVSEIEGATVTIELGGKSLLFTATDESRSYSFTYQIDNQLEATVTVSSNSLAKSDFYTFDKPTEQTLRIVDRLAIPENYVGEGVITSLTQPDNGGEVSITDDGRSVVLKTGVGSGAFEYTIDGKYSATVSTHYNQRLQSDYSVAHQNSGTTSLDPLTNDFNEHTVRRWGRYNGRQRITGVESNTNNGTAEIAADGKGITFKPNVDFVGTESITYTVDGFLQATIEVAVARLLRHDRVRVAPESSNNTLNVLGNDLVGGDYQGALTITGVSAGSEGATISVAADGKSVIYTPAAGFAGTDTFEYSVDDQLKANVTVEVHSDAKHLYPKIDSLEAFKQLVIASTQNTETNPWLFLDGDFSAVAGGIEQREHSETNVQVEGVDEADLIETDSSFLYTLTHGQLVITKAWPANEMQVVSRTEIKGSPIGQYLLDDRLTVISQERSHFGFIDVAIDSIHPYPQVDPITYVTVLDVSDRANPTLVQRTEVEGNHVQTRRIDDYVYLVVRDSQSLVPPRIQVCDESGESPVCHFETEEERLQRIENDFASVVEDLLPNFESYGPDGKLVRAGLLIQPEDIFDPISDRASSLVSVVAIDVTNNEPGLATTTGVLTTGASELYVTSENLYVLEDHYDWFGNGQLDDSPSTKILKFELDSESGGVSFAATGQVPGRMLNQFSADEYDGHLRIATSVSNNRTGNYSGNNENALFVLRDDVGVFEHVGTLQNLALDESIRSVRFFGDRALVTTFQTVDPLFSVDLSDHSHPSVEGYLTLPGYASYTQYVDENHVLTIGRNTGTGWGGVVVMSLFNVSDILQPVLVDQFNWASFSHSVAETDHHAFGWFPSHGTLAIPSQVNSTLRTDEDNDGYREYIQHVTDHELHAFAIDTSFNAPNDDAIQVAGTVPMDSPLLRSAFIDDKLYAVARDSIKSTEIAAPDNVIAEVIIKRPDDEIPEPIADPRLATMAALGMEARHSLSAAKGLRAEEVMLVATEATDDRTKLLLRVGDEHFVYEGTGETLELEPQDYRYASASQFDWHNEGNPIDTNGDGLVTPRDVLLIVNMINKGDGGKLPTGTVVSQIEQLSDAFQVDTNGDGFVTASDALRVINHLNAASHVQPPPPAAALSDAVFALTLTDDDDEIVAPASLP